MAADSIKKTFFVAFTLCVVCSVLVSSAAVKMKPRQQLNKELDIKKNLLLSAGLLANSGASQQEIDAAYKKIEPVVIDLNSGTVTSTPPESFNMKNASRNPKSNYTIPPSLDKARIRVRAKQALVYLVRENGAISQLVLPVYGKGLYSTMYGFLALASDTSTVTGFAFYDQGETPGLGGEVNSTAWKAQWPGKSVLDPAGWQPVIQVIKGGVQPGSKEAAHQVDAVSGATMTSRGVENLLHYWLGDNGYGPFLASFRKSGGKL